MINTFDGAFMDCEKLIPAGESVDCEWVFSKNSDITVERFLSYKDLITGLLIKISFSRSLLLLPPGFNLFVHAALKYQIVRSRDRP